MLADFGEALAAGEQSDVVPGFNQPSREQASQRTGSDDQEFHNVLPKIFA
jgi:hypothetical protein